MMEKRRFLELFETAVKTAKSVNGIKSSEVSRCLDAMARLKEAPESLACDVLSTTTIGKSYSFFVDHKNPKIRTESRLLWDLWLTHLYSTGTKQSKPKDHQIPVKPTMKKKRVTACSPEITTGDSKRGKVREILLTSLAKVATEVVGTEMKERVSCCDPWLVAESVESAMFEELGCFLGPQKAKYRSILFNMGDSNNPDLRRKVLIGDISGERLVTMEKHEMGSDKIQMEVALIKEKARFREENRIKMMNQSDMIMSL